MANALSLFGWRGVVVLSICSISITAAWVISDEARRFPRISVLQEGPNVDGLGEVVSMAFANDRIYLASQRDHCLTVLSLGDDAALKVEECLVRDRSDPGPAGSRKLPWDQVVTIDAATLRTTHDGKVLFFACGGSVLLFEHGDDKRLQLLGYHGESGAFIGQLPGYLRCALSPDEKFLYATRSRDGEIEVIRFDRDANRMTSVQTVQNLGWCIEIALSPDGRHLYAASRSNNVLYIFNVDPRTGELTQAGQLADRECGVRNLAVATTLSVSPDGRYVVLATGMGSGYVSILRRNPDNGLLTKSQEFNSKQGGVADLVGPTCAIFSADSSKLFLGCSGDRGVVVLRNSPGSDSFAQLETIHDSTVTNPTCLGINGPYLFVCSQEPGTVTVFRIDDQKRQASP